MSQQEEHDQLEGTGKAKHHFDPRKVERLYSPDRLETLAIKRLLSELALCPGQRVLDLGTGGGVLLPSLSGAVGEKGMVVGSDNSKEMLDYINEKLWNEIPDNIELCLNGDKRLPLRNDFFHRVLMVCLLHELARPQSVLEEVSRVLRPGGRLLALEWKAEVMDPGPPVSHRLSAEK
jgi:ubiquinone/menaquinone biosynthesis C-methylase UbiE